MMLRADKASLLLATTFLSLMPSPCSGQIGGYRYMVRGGGGKEAAISLGGRVVVDIPKLGITALEFHDKTSVHALEDLANKSNFDIEEDPIRTPIPATPSKGGERTSAESIPWGIERTFNTASGPNVPGSGYFPNSTPHPVCVIDSGYDINHVDLPNDAQGVIAVDSSWASDPCEHGTHVTGTIAAISGNNQGVIGVWPGAPGIRVAKVFDGTGCGYSYASTVLNAAQECAASGADIISMSLSGPFSSFERDGFQDLYNDGILPIAAAGNGGSSSYAYPASYDGVMSVAATDINNNAAYFSQYNDQVEIAAPGVSVESTVPGNGYESWQGTSMATPHVSGAALLLWGKYPSATNVQVREALTAGAVDLGAAGRDNVFGHGLLNYWNALDELSRVVSPTVSPRPTEYPTTSEPTGSPTPCDGTSFLLRLLTDNWGGETTWTLKTQPGNTLVAEGGPYGNAQLYEEEDCLNDGCYLFTINDSYGDGICCGYGEGSYEVIVGGEVVRNSNGDFGSSESTDFCVAQDDDDTCTDSGLPISFRGLEITCDFVLSRDKCGNPKAASHCPDTCSMCEMYGCADSEAPFEFDGVAEFCSTIPLTACNIPEVTSTCRETCNFC